MSFSKRYLRKPLVTATAIAAVLAAGPVAMELTADTATASTLAGSAFESADGNNGVDTSGNGDWDSFSAATAGTLYTGASPYTYYRQPDQASGSGDNAFGQGAKEDVPNPTVVSGSIPPNKSDLSNFHVAYETVAPTAGNGFSGNHTFLYLKWDRLNVLGNANMDFEFNQNAPSGTPPVAHFYSDGLAVRSNGDLLVTYDYSGSGTPTLSLFRWLTGNGASVPGTTHVETVADCFSANALPCWGYGTLGNLSNAAEANGKSFADGKSGEAGLDLTAAHVFGTDCTTFGDALLKSRSSSSFTSEIKDFIVIPHGKISVSNCGSITVNKQDDAGTPITGALTPAATFELWKDNAPLKASQTDPTTHEATNDTELSSLTCALASTASSCTISNVPFGSYWVVETQHPTGYNFALDGYVTISSSHMTGSVTLTDNRAPAEVDITKVDDNSSPVDGATFTLYNDLGTVGQYDSGVDTATSYTCTTADHSPSPGDGTCSITGIVDPGHYVVRETTTPTGYDKSADQFINVTLGTTYSVANSNLSAFVDTRNFKVIVFVCDQTTGKLYPSSVSFDGSVTPKTSLAPSSTALSSAQQDAVCGLAATDGATFPNKHASATAKTGSVTIPLHQ